MLWQKISKMITIFRPIKRAENHLDSLIEEKKREIDTYNQEADPLRIEIEAESEFIKSEIERLDARFQVALTVSNMEEIDRIEAANNKLKKRNIRSKKQTEELSRLTDVFKEQHEISKVKIEKAQVRLSRWLVIVSISVILALIAGVTWLSVLLTGEFTNDIHMSYYEALAQIFPVVLIALFIGNVSTNDEGTRRSIWVSLIKGSKHIGLLAVAIGEIACLSALMNQSSNSLLSNATSISLGILCSLLFVRVVEGRLD